MLKTRIFLKMSILCALERKHRCGTPDVCYPHAKSEFCCFTARERSLCAISTRFYERLVFYSRRGVMLPRIEAGSRISRKRSPIWNHVEDNKNNVSTVTGNEDFMDIFLPTLKEKEKNF